MALLEVVLLAGPAFAVIARRMQRSLALMAATGATPPQARRVVLASGLVLGAAGADAGGRPRAAGRVAEPAGRAALHRRLPRARTTCRGSTCSASPASGCSRRCSPRSSRPGSPRGRTWSRCWPAGAATAGRRCARRCSGCCCWPPASRCRRTAPRPSAMGVGEYFIAVSAIVAVLGMILLVPVVVVGLARARARRCRCRCATPCATRPATAPAPSRPSPRWRPPSPAWSRSASPTPATRPRARRRTPSELRDGAGLAVDLRRPARLGRLPGRGRASTCPEAEVTPVAGRRQGGRPELDRRDVPRRR